MVGIADTIGAKAMNITSAIVMIIAVFMGSPHIKFCCFFGFSGFLRPFDRNVFFIIVQSDITAVLPCLFINWVRDKPFHLILHIHKYGEL
jgi:hypothetical protein